MDNLADRVAAVPRWWHSIDLGQGVVTPGRKDPNLLAEEFGAIRLPDLSGKTVLDIGAWDGWFSFECERRGAKRVVALDIYEYPKNGVWLEGITTARAALGSSIEIVSDDIMTADLAALGTFDIVLFLGVLYHLMNPLLGLTRLAQVTAGSAYVESQVVVIGGHPDISACQFYESDELENDDSNYWAPTLPALAAMCRTAGFSGVEITKGPFDDLPPAPEIHAHRAIVRCDNPR
jgi:tRNA (mo5U34)-methyltransferase